MVISVNPPDSPSPSTLPRRIPRCFLCSTRCPICLKNYFKPLLPQISSPFILSTILPPRSHHLGSFTGSDLHLAFLCSILSFFLVTVEELALLSLHLCPEFHVSSFTGNLTLAISSSLSPFCTRNLSSLLHSFHIHIKALFPFFQAFF